MKIKFYASLIILIGMLGSRELIGQTYTSVTTGNWNEASTWDLNAVPDATNSTSIVIQGGHTVTIPDGYSVSADQIAVKASSTLSIAAGGILTLAPGDGTDLALASGFGGTGYLSVSGTLIGADATSISSTATNCSIRDGGIYEHQHTETAGTIPKATWNDGSTLRITGYTSNESVPANLGDSFYHVEWSTPGLDNLNSIFDLAGILRTVRGNLTVSNTGNAYLVFSIDAPYILSIGGDLNISNNSRVAFAYTNGITGTREVNISGSLNYTSGQTSFFTDEAPLTVNIGTDFQLNSTGGGIEFLQVFSSGSGSVDLYVAGNTNWNSGDLFKSGSGIASVTFDGSSVQTFSSSITSAPDLNFTVTGTSTLNLGTSVLRGGGNFTIQDNAGLGLGSAATDGAWQNSLSAGNIQVSGTRTYGDFLTITYNGTAAQKTGPDFPETKSINLIIDNPTSVTLSEDVTIRSTQTLNLVQGTFNIGSQTLTLNGSINSTTGTIGAITTSNLAVGGSGALGTIPFNSTSNTLNNFTLARTTSGSVTLGGDFSVLGNMVFTDGQLILNGHALTLSGTVSQTSGSIVSNSASSLIIQGEGVLGNIPFAGGSEIGTLTVDRVTGGSAGLNGNLLVTNSLNLNNGAFENGAFLTMGNNSTITRAAGGSLAGAPTVASGNSYNVVYTSGLTTGPELPSGSTELKNLTVNATGTVSLNTNIVVNGPLELTNGTFDLATHTVELKGNLITNASLQPSSGTILFNGISEVSGSTTPAFNHVQVATGSTVNLNVSNFTVAGNWQNEGTIIPGSSTVTFNNSTSFSGSVAPDFHHVEIAGALTAPAGNFNVSGNWVYTSGTFTPNGGSIIFNGAGQNINAGGQLFYNTIFAGSGTKILAGALTVNHDLTINAGSTLDVSTSIYPVEVKLHWVNNGIFIPRTGTVTFSGSSLQTIDGSSISNFYNLNISNIAAPTGVRALKDVTLTRLLTLSENAVFDPDGSDGTVNFHLSSYANSTAGIATLPAGAVVDGSVVVERYIHDEGKIYRYISTPVTSAIVRDWNDDFTVRGNYSGATTTGTPNLYAYNEALDGTLNSGWEAYPPSGGSITDPLDVGRGFAAGLIEGNTVVVASIKGPVQQGSLPLPLSYNPTTNGTTDDFGWNLVGNPYPAAIDWTQVGKSSVTTKVYIPDNSSGTLTYATFDSFSGTGTNGGSKDIASGQAFWVKATGSGSSLSFTENSKSSNTGTEFFRVKALKDVLKIALNHESERDETVIIFRENGARAFDEHDGLKRMNSSLNLSTLSEEGKQLTYNYWPLFSCNTEIKIQLETAKTGSFSIDFDHLGTLPENMVLELSDLYTKTVTTITPETVYSFEVTGEAGSKGAERFVLRASYTPVETALQVTATAVCGSETGMITVQGTQQNVYYQLMDQDTQIGETLLSAGGDLHFEVSESNLLTGENSFTIQAFRTGCDPVALIQPALIQKSAIYEITSTEGASVCGPGSVTLKAEGAPEGGLYRWYSGPDGNLLKETSSTEFTTPELHTTTYYFVTAVSPGGCESSKKRKVQAAVQALPVIENVQGAAGCEGSSLTLQASSDQANSLFRWYSDAEGTNFLAENDGIFATPELSASSTFYVAAVSEGGCEVKERVAVEAIISKTEHPEIVVKKNKLSIAGTVAGKIQWHLNGEAIEGATTATYKAAESGSYTVSVTTNQCAAFSPAQLLQVKAIDTEIAEVIKFWPNPANNELFIQLLPGIKGKLQIKLLNVNGSTVKTAEAKGGTSHKLDLSGIAAGLYILEIKVSGQIYRTRISKQ